MTRATLTPQGAHGAVNNFVPMADAATTAYLRLIGPVGVSAVGRSVMARLLADVVTIYTYAGQENGVRALTAAEIRRGTFIHGGRQIQFADGEMPIIDIAVARNALDAAIEVMSRRGTVKALFEWRAERG